MIIKPCGLPGIYEITVTPRTDHRGRFTRVYDQRIFENYGIACHWVQENVSLSKHKGTIRGLHLQLGPYAETKLIRVSKGAIFDVFVDLREGSPTFGRWDSVLLTEDNHKLIYIPRGFAHGFCTLTDDCEVIYKVDNYYAPAHEAGLNWRDDSLRITWPVLKPIISDKDKYLPTLQEFIKIHRDINKKGR